MPKPLTIAERLARFTPIACRLLARKKGGSGGVIALTDEEIAAGSGLTVPQIASLSRKTAWGDTPVDQILAFARGCGVDLDSRESMQLHYSYMQNLRSTPKYLMRSPDWATKFQPLIKAWMRSMGA